MATRSPPASPRRRAGGVGGRVEILVCAAANPHLGPFPDTPDDAFDETIRVDPPRERAPLPPDRAGVRARGDGAIVVTSSHRGLEGLGRTRPLRPDRGRRATRPQPRPRLTGRTRSAPTASRARWGGPTSPARAGRTGRAEVAEGHALERPGEPRDVAGGAVMPAGPAGAWMTGPG